MAGRFFLVVRKKMLGIQDSTKCGQIRPRLLDFHEAAHFQQIGDRLAFPYPLPPAALCTS
jgi:hypothetical protein